jgi:hypothetical protein
MAAESSAFGGSLDVNRLEPFLSVQDCAGLVLLTAMVYPVEVSIWILSKMLLVSIWCGEGLFLPEKVWDVLAQRPHADRHQRHCLVGMAMN